MSKRIKVKINNQGFYNLRRDPGLVSKMERGAQSVASQSMSQAQAAGHDANYAVGSVQGARKPQGRWRVSIITANAAAMVDNHYYQRILKNMRKGGW